MHRLATDVPFIACVINLSSTFTQYLDLSNFCFILRYGLSYFRILAICLLLVYFVSPAGCHCFDLYELDGFLCMVHHWSPRLPEILQFFSLTSLHSNIERHCIFLLQFTYRIYFSIHILIAEGTKKRDPLVLPERGGGGGGMSSCNTKSGIRTGTKQDKLTRTSAKTKLVSCSCGQLCKNFRGLKLHQIKVKR